MDSRRFRTAAGKSGLKKTTRTEGFNFTEAFDELDAIEEEIANEASTVESDMAITENVDKMSDDDIRRMVADERGTGTISAPVTQREKEVDANILYLTRQYLKDLENGVISQEQFNTAFRRFIGIDPKTGRYNPDILFKHDTSWMEALVTECKTKLNECGQAKAEDAEPTADDQI